MLVCETKPLKETGWDSNPYFSAPLHIFNRNFGAIHSWWAKQDFIDCLNLRLQFFWCSLVHLLFIETATLLFFLRKKISSTFELAIISIEVGKCFLFGLRKLLIMLQLKYIYFILKLLWTCIFSVMMHNFVPC